MKTLSKILSSHNIQKGEYYPYEIDTEIGKLQIDLRNGHLFTNFIGTEIKAKIIFGHWKNNSLVKTEEDVIVFIDELLRRIKDYKKEIVKSFVN